MPERYEVEPVLRSQVAEGDRLLRRDAHRREFYVETVTRQTFLETELPILRVAARGGAEDELREALERIVAIGAAPRDSIESRMRIYRQRGQAMLDVAQAALAAHAASTPG